MFTNLAYPKAPLLKLSTQDGLSLNSKNFLPLHNNLAESTIWLTILLTIETSFIFFTVVVVTEKAPEETVFLTSGPSNLSIWLTNLAYPKTLILKFLTQIASSLNSKNFLLDHNSLAESDIWLIILLIIETSFIFLTVVVVVVCPNPKKPPDLIESFSSYPNSLSTSFAKVAKGITLEDKLLTQELSNLNPKNCLELNNNLAAPAI